MRARFALIGTGVALAATLGVVLAWLAFDSSSTAAHLAPDASAPSDPPVALRDVEPSPDIAVPTARIDTPEARAALASQAERQRFERRVSEFLDHPEAFDDAERARIAAELDAQVEAEELAGRMSADEARMVRLALIERGTKDAAERLRRAEALADAYRRDAERRQRAFEQQQASDPRFRDYKAREAQVVAEVMRLREIPGGISRDEYLRQRLQAERERAYRAGPGG